MDVSEAQKRKLVGEGTLRRRNEAKGSYRGEKNPEKEERIKGTTKREREIQNLDGGL